MNTATKKRGTGLNIYKTAKPTRRYGVIEPMEYPRQRFWLWRKEAK